MVERNAINESIVEVVMYDIYVNQLTTVPSSSSLEQTILILRYTANILLNPSTSPFICFGCRVQSSFLTTSNSVSMNKYSEITALTCIRLSLAMSQTTSSNASDA